ncbi:hypothetical protein [Acidithiobacillus sp.]|uniref:hypothetical protein n=1 Tax=Acidithiobacillus sp. TaxID=1872118 RepID=UPI00356A0C5A
MTNAEKNNIFNSFKSRTERDVMVNQGVSVPFGDISISIKALDWDRSNKFEDKVVEIIKGFKDLMGEKVEENIEGILMKILSLLREDLVELSNIATNGEVTLEYIRENKATKNDLMKLVIEAFSVNYSYAKNLIALSKQIR